jgi:hypothetical protein
MARGHSRARTSVSGNNRALAATAAALLLATGCGGTPEPVAEAAPYLDPGYVETGDVRLHYALTLASDLPAAIAGSYGILPRTNLAVLTVAITPRDAGAGAALADARAAATAVSLTGVRTPLALSRRDEPGGATWIGMVDVRHRVPFTIEIEAHATSDGPPLRARLTREFRLE